MREIERQIENELIINEDEDPIETSQITSIQMQDLLMEREYEDDNPPTLVENSQSLRDFMQVEEEIERQSSSQKDRTMLNDYHLKEEDPL